MATGAMRVPGAPTASPVRRWVAAHPIATYLAVAYALSWACWLPLAIGSRTTAYGVGWPSHFPGLTGPAVAAVIVTAIAGGRAGLVDLASHLARWRVGWAWLSVPGILAAGAIGLAIAGGVDHREDLWLFNGLSRRLGLLGTVLAVLVLNGVGEETGWRGFMVPRLLERHSLTVTALLVAMVWGAWHTPLFFFLDSFQDFSIGSTAGWASGLVAGSVVLTWLSRVSGGSVLLVAAWHTAFNFTSATPVASGPVAATTSTVVMVAAVAIIVVDWRSHRSS